MIEHREISPGRKIAFYCGYLCMAFGAFLIISLFFMGIGELTPSRLYGLGIRAVLGFGSILIGAILRRVAIRGLAGSLVILDPPKAREDLEPWSRMAGGLVDSALSEIDAVKEVSGAIAPRETIKVRCPSCKALSDEKARYCSQCGKEL